MSFTRYPIGDTRTADVAAKQDEPLGELQHSVLHNDHVKEERAISDAKYADKLVEKIVFGLVSMILIGVVTAFIALVVR